MNTYQYTAKDLATGESVKADVQADSEQAAAKLLIRRNLFPINIIPKGAARSVFKVSFGKRVRTKDRIIFTRQLATLVNAGLPILQSLRSVQEQMSNPLMREIVGQIVNDVEGGSSLSAAFSRHPNVFNQTVVSLIAAGESSGTLDKTLERLAYQMEKDAQVYSKIRGALIYPAIVLTVIVVVMVFLLTVVLPQIGLIYKDFNKELPLVTKLLLGVSSAITRFWWLWVIALVGGSLALRRYVKTDTGRTQFDRSKLILPLFGKLFQKVYMARFCRTAATLLASGVPMLNSLDITKDTLNNKAIADSFQEIMKDVRAGKALSATLFENSYFLRVVPQMIKIGEDSGQIDAVLDKLASYFENEIDETVKTLSTAVEPILMVVMGLTVGLIMAAVLLPIYGLVSSGLQ